MSKQSKTLDLDLLREQNPAFIQCFSINKLHIFILTNVKQTDAVLHPGCNLGDISFLVAEKAQLVIRIDYSEKGMNTINCEEPMINKWHGSAS